MYLRVQKLAQAHSEVRTVDETKREREIREDTLKEVLMLLDLAISRSRASRASEGFRALIRETLTGARQELVRLELPEERAPEPRTLLEVQAGSPLEDRREPAVQEVIS